MLIQLSGRPTVDPAQYPHRLVVELDTGGGFGRDGHPECGVVSGQHDGFEEPEEMNQRLPVTSVDEEVPWIQRFEIRAPNRSQPHRCCRYHYVATQWHNGVYAEYPIPTELILEDSAGSWSVILGCGITIHMVDYSPWDQP